MIYQAGIFSIAAVFLMRETYEPVLLEHKAARLRKETGNSRLEACTYRQDATPRQLVIQAFLRPTKMLIFSPIVLLSSLYCAFIFGLIFLLFTTFPTVFEDVYGFSPGLSGLAYLGLGLGMLTGIVLFGLFSDKLLKQPRGGTVARPELRLILMMWFSPVTPIGFFWYRWTSSSQIHWIVPILGTFFIGLGAFFIVLPVQIYYVDIFGNSHSTSAPASNLLLRNLAGTFLVLAATPLYAELGLGWGNSALGFICLAFVPIFILF